ncbi:MAG: hypothetical protein B6D64_12485 [Bacteroidetes bacterium 4484_276]|nr:MAG: hypothetical protein B6D64_12485 [Bacteroidetes bacterium 4484_276]
MKKRKRIPWLLFLFYYFAFNKFYHLMEPSFASRHFMKPSFGGTVILLHCHLMKPSFFVL